MRGDDPASVLLSHLETVNLPVGILDDFQPGRFERVFELGEELLAYVFNLGRFVRAVGPGGPNSQPQQHQGHSVEHEGFFPFAHRFSPEANHWVAVSFV